MADRCLVPSSQLRCVLSAAVALVVGCAGNISAPAFELDPPEADGGGTSPAEVQPLAASQWQDLDLDERKRFMREVVMPAMRTLFSEADPERFADFSCSSCHGAGTADGTFAMPSMDLPPLGAAPADADVERMQRVTDFMRSQVKPKMAELLGDAELRCSQCHPSAS